MALLTSTAKHFAQREADIRYSNTLSLADFRIMDKELSRKELSLPDKHIILFGAARIDDPIKGVEYLIQAIRLLIEKKKIPARETPSGLIRQNQIPGETIQHPPRQLHLLWTNR